MESPARFDSTKEWTTELHPQLQMAGCEIKSASLKATAVGVPTSKQRVFIIAVKRYGDSGLRSKLDRWKMNVERQAPSPPTVGAFVGKQGSFFLKRPNAKQIFSFDEPTVTITQEQIMARKPSASDFKRHQRDAGTLEDAQELSWDDYVKLTTTRTDGFVIPRALRRRDAALVMEEYTLLPMLTEVLSLL